MIVNSVIVSCTAWSLAVLFSACSLNKRTKSMEKNTEEMNETTQDMNQSTQKMSETTEKMAASTETMEKKTTDMAKDTKEVKAATLEMVQKTEDMNKTTKEMQKSTQEVASVTGKMAATTDHMAETTDKMAGTTAGMAATTMGMAATTEKMAATTDHMSATTDKMSETTERVAAISEALKTETTNLYVDNRQGASLQARNSALDRLPLVSDQLAKISYAGEFMMALEYQLWKGQSADSEQKLLALKKDAIDELVRLCHQYVPENRSISPLGTSDSMKTLYALAATLHVVNTNGILNDVVSAHFEDKLPSGIVGVVSPLELIKDGLSKKAALESGSISQADLTPAQNAVLQHEGVFTYLLHVRNNFVTAMVTSQLAVADGQELSFFGRLQRLLFPWKARTEVRNLSELEHYTFLMGSVTETQKFLKSIQAPAPMDKKLLGFIRKMSFKEGELYGTIEARQTLVKNLASEYQKLLNP